MQEQISKIINDSISIDSITKANISYDGTEKVNKNKIDAEFNDLLREELSSDDFLKFFDLPVKQKRSILMIALVDAEKAQRESSGYSEKDALVDRLQLFVVKDGESQDNIRVWDDEKKEFNWTYSSVKAFLGEKLINYLPKYICTENYDPEVENDSNQIDWEVDGQVEVASVNLYKHPSWRSEIDLSDLRHISEKIQLPDSARAFFKHLFPEKESRHYVYEYLYHAMTERNGCEYILVLHGPTGTGKTTFADDLMRGLFGDGNWGAAPKALFKSTFNKVLLNKRVLYLDEGKVTRDTYATVKLYANTHMNIEKKGVDADNTSELFFSLLVSSNTMGDYYIHYDDRRSSIVETTSKNLSDIWSDKKIKKFKAELRDEDFVGEIGKFILSRSWTDDDEELNQFKGDKYYKFVYRHLSAWEKNVIKSVMKSGERGQEEITVQSLLMKIDNDKRINYDLQEDTLVEFLLGYKHLGEHLLGELAENDEKERVLLIGDYFYKEIESEEETGEDLL